MHASGQIQPDLPNGLHKDVTLNGLPQTDSDLDSDSDGYAPDPSQEAAEQTSGADVAFPYNSQQPSGAPQPLEPQLVTLSLLPRSQWQSLVHLDAIKVAPLLKLRLTAYMYVHLLCMVCSVSAPCAVESPCMYHIFEPCWIAARGQASCILMQLGMCRSASVCSAPVCQLHYDARQC